MNTFHKNFCIITVLYTISAFSFANQPQSFPQLNQLDAAEQQRQQQQQQAQQKQLQHQADVRLDTSNYQQFTLSNHESPCYPKPVGNGR